MAVVTLRSNNEQQVSCEAPNWGTGIEEILYIPTISSDLGEDSENNLQQFWVLEGVRHEKLKSLSVKYEDAAKALAEAKTKLANAEEKLEKEHQSTPKVSKATIEAADSAREEFKIQQDNIRATLAKGFGQKKDDSVMPVPQGATKKLIECIGFVNKKTYYISTKDLGMVKDTDGKEKFRFDTNSLASQKSNAYEVMKAVMTDSKEGTADDKTRAVNSEKDKDGNYKKDEEGNYVDEKWAKQFFGELKVKIIKEWKFGEGSVSGTASPESLAGRIDNKVIKEFLTTNDTCVFVSNAIKYFNTVANFSYQKYTDKLKQIKILLLKKETDFDHHDWGKALLLVQEIWSKTDNTFLDDIITKNEKIPMALSKRTEIFESINTHPLPPIIFDASGGAQLMRYTANCGGAASFDFTKGIVGVGYGAKAEFNLAEAGAGFNLYAPNINGLKLKFEAPVHIECYEVEKLSEAGKGENNLDPMFAHNSSFLLPAAIIDTAQQLQGIKNYANDRENKELLVQVAGYTDSSGKDDYNMRLSKRRATATKALFTNDRAQWKEFFDKNMWKDEERDMMLVSLYMIEHHPVAFKNSLENYKVGNDEKLRNIVKKQLKLALSDGYGYDVESIRSTSLKNELIKELKIKSKPRKPVNIEFGDSREIINIKPLKDDFQIATEYFGWMREYALKKVTRLTYKDFDLFHVDSDIYPIIGHGETKQKEDVIGKHAVNRRVTFTTYGMRRDKQPSKATINLGEGRFRFEGRVTAKVGVTLGLSAKMGLNTYKGRVQLMGKKKEDDVIAEYNGTEVKPTKIGDNNITADVEAFAGAKAEASLSAILEWNNPEVKTERFKLLASIGGSVTGSAGAGISGESKIGYDTTSGTFQVKMKAEATWGLGGGGSWNFSVGIQQLYDFVKLIYNRLQEHDFNFVDIFEDELDETGAQTDSKLNVYEGYVALLSELWKEENYIGAGVGFIAAPAIVGTVSLLGNIDALIERYKIYDENKTNTENLINNILADKEVLYYLPPEVKGRWLYMLTAYKPYWASFELGDNYAKAEKAALAIIEGISHGREWQETFEKMTLKNVNGDYEPYDRTKEDVNEDRCARYNYSITYLRNELLNDTEDWDRVRKHAKTITTWDKSWNKEPSLLEKIF